MSSYPDAHALVRTILSNPADPVPRLVFADWVEESGRRGSAAWAEYIRLGTQLQTDAVAGRRDELAGAVTARLTIPADLLVARAGSVLAIMPASRVTVRLGGHRTPRAVVELVPESVARESIVLPLSLIENSLLLATPRPDNPRFTELMGWVLNKDLVLVRAAEADVHEGIAAHYGSTETEAFDTVLWDYPRAEPTTA